MEPLGCAPNPCDSCPYRKDTPPGVWAAAEYRKLPAWDDPMQMKAGVFLCHNGDRKLACRGWLEVHHENLGVRLALMTGRIDLGKHSKPTKVLLYKSGAEACDAGLKGVKRPGKKAKDVIVKLTVQRSRKK